MFYTKKLVLFLLIAFFSLSILGPFSVSAQTAQLGTQLLNTPSVFNQSGVGISSFQYNGIKPFGGRIISMQPCKTPAGIMLNIGGPRGGQFLLTDSVKIFNYGVFNPGIWTLGTAGASTVTCKGESGLFSPSFGTALMIAGSAISLYSTFGTNFLFQQAIGDTVLKFSSAQIGSVLGIAGFASKFGFGKKPTTIGNPHIIQMIGTSF